MSADQAQKLAKIKNDLHGHRKKQKGVLLYKHDQATHNGDIATYRPLT